MFFIYQIIVAYDGVQYYYFIIAAVNGHSFTRLFFFLK